MLDVVFRMMLVDIRSSPTARSAELRSIVVVPGRPLRVFDGNLLDCNLLDDSLFISSLLVVRIFGVSLFGDGIQLGLKQNDDCCNDDLFVCVHDCNDWGPPKVTPTPV